MLKEDVAPEQDDWGAIHPALERWSLAVHEDACHTWDTDKEDDDDTMVCAQEWKRENSWPGVCWALSAGIQGDRDGSVDDSGPFWNDESVEAGIAHMFRSFMMAIRDEVIAVDSPNGSFNFEMPWPHIMVEASLMDTTEAVIICGDTVLLSYERKSWWFLWEDLKELNEEMAELTAQARLKYESIKSRLIGQREAESALWKARLSNVDV